MTFTSVTFMLTLLFKRLIKMMTTNMSDSILIASYLQLLTLQSMGK